MRLELKLMAIVVIAFLLSCGGNNSRTEYDTIKEYLTLKLDGRSLDGIKRVFILTENSCIGCNKTFANMALLERNNPESIIIVKRMGYVIDVSQFEGDSITNVIFDNEEVGSESDTLFSMSRFLLLGKGRLDTMLTIQAQTLYQDMEYILQPSAE